MADTDIVTRLAREAGASVYPITDGHGEGSWICTDKINLARFAALVAEECARIIEAQDVDPAFKGRMAWALRDRFKA